MKNRKENAFQKEEDQALSLKIFEKRQLSLNSLNIFQCAYNNLNDHCLTFFNFFDFDALVSTNLLWGNGKRRANQSLLR